MNAVYSIKKSERNLHNFSLVDRCYSHFSIGAIVLAEVFFRKEFESYMPDDEACENSEGFFLKSSDSFFASCSSEIEEYSLIVLFRWRVISITNYVANILTIFQSSK